MNQERGFKDFEGTILVDTDDVVVRFVPALCEYVNYIGAGKKRKFTHLDVNEWDLCKVFGVGVPEIIDILNGFYESDFFLSARPSDEAVDAIEHLSFDHGLVVNTARPCHLEKHTQDFYDAFFPGKIRDLRFARQDSIPSTHHKPTKVEIGIEYMPSLKFAIDDAPDHAYGYAEVSIPVLLPDQAWNKDVDHKLITRVGKNGEGHWHDIHKIAYKHVLSEI